METVLITGGSGLIGRNLSMKFIRNGYRVSVLSTSGKAVEGCKTYLWNPVTGMIDVRAVEDADYIINLAGANIGAKKWTKNRKLEIIESRIKSGEVLFETYLQNPGRLKAFITASATGYYGAITSEKIFIEDNPPAGDFVGETCRLWEETASQFEKAGIRTVKLRTGIVLDKYDGALARLLLPMKLYAGSAMGSGKQYMPWIHLDDLCEMYFMAICAPEMNGAFNAAAPYSVTNQEFTRCLANVLHKPLWFPKIPSLVLKVVFGEMSSIILEGSRVSAEKIIKAGFSFRFPELKPALEDILIRMPKR
jgi:uncharacterized protein (TIGR01777 family)